MTVLATCPARAFVDGYIDRIVADYGVIRYVNERFVYGDEIDGERLPPEFQKHIERAAAEFDPAADFLLIGGDYLQLVALTTALAGRHGAFRALRWDKKAEGYLAVWIGTIAAARSIRDLTPATTPC